MTPDLHELHIVAGRLAGRERTCGTKIAYGSEESAAKAADSMNSKPATRNVLEAYPCAFCDQWHVGRKMSEDELRAAAASAGGGVLTDDEWDKQRERAVMAAFQTGRPVFADSEGKMRYVDGDLAPVPDEIGQAAGRVARQAQPLPRAVALAVRAERASRVAYVTAIVAAGVNAVFAYWHPWQLVSAAVLGFCAIIWRRVNRHQRTGLGGRRDA